MLKNLRAITIQGRCFKNKVTLELFKNLDDRVSLIYGRNGSGKSTISKGIKFAIDEREDKDIDVKFIDGNASEIPIKDIKDETHIFNEEYIDRNVRIDDDGLGTILLIGPQVAFQTDIERHTLLREEAKKKKDQLEKELIKYQDPKNAASPEFYLDKIKQLLRQPNGWAETESKIKGNKQNAAVTDTVIQNIYGLSSSETLDELQSSFESTRKLFEQITDPAITYKPVPELDEFTEEIENNLIELLARKIDEPTLSLREQQILNAIKEGRQNDIETVRDYFLNPDITYCPYCYQEVSETYKATLLNSIEKILNKDVDDHKIELRQVVFPILNLNFEEYKSLNASLVEQIQVKLVQCEDIIRIYQDAIQKKLNNIYKPVIIDKKLLSESICELSKLIQTLKACKSEFDAAIKQKKKIQDRLILLNKKIAYFTIKDLYNNYLIQKAEKAQQEIYYSAAGQSYSDEDKEIQRLQAKKSDVSIAIDLINNALEYIFFSNDRLTIELHDGKYYLKSKGANVLPKNISQGERNIIALCYFFAQIMENQEAEKLFQKEQFIIVDDPISSFDFENKVGILSYLRYQLLQILTCNTTSKVIILTHDLSTMLNLYTILEDIASSVKSDDRFPNITFSKLELRDNAIYDFQKKHNEYLRLLNDIYDYAENGPTDEGLVIGNIMRRVLEAFSTFVYNKGIEQLTNDPNIIASLGNHSTYFSNLMYRLVLHGESHYEKQIHSMRDNVSFFGYISNIEKQRTAKDLLCMLYKLNPSHIEAYLPEKRKIIQIKQWLKAIKTDADFKLEEKLLCSKKVVKLYDYALSAGQGIDLMDEQVPYEEIEVDNLSADFAIKISGDSMEPRINNGSIALIKQADILADGHIGAFYYDGEVFCKIFRKTKTEVFLESVNKKYSPIYLAENASFKIYGEVIAVLNSVNH